MSNEQKLREFSEWLDTYRDLPVHEVFHEIVLRYEEALATTEPAVNQQLTTEPFDEREAFEKWLGIKPCGAAHDFGWSAWQARAALAARKPLSDMDRAVLRMPMDMALGNDIGRLQYYQRVQGLLDRLDGIGLEVKT